VFLYVDPAIDWFQFGIDFGLGEGVSAVDQAWLGAALELDYDQPYSMRAVLDPRVNVFELYLDDRLVLSAEYQGATDIAFGGNTYHNDLFSDQFNGDIEQTPITMNLCRDLLPSVAPASS